MRFWLPSYTEMNIGGNLTLMIPWNKFLLCTLLLSLLGSIAAVSGLKSRTSINGFNAIRQKRDLLTAEKYEPSSGARSLRVFTETFIPQEGSCPHTCLNGAHCTDAGVCDCENFQAQGNRCQFVPNTGKEREGICKSWGQYNFETFDGIYFYYPGNCSYIFARDCSQPVPLYTIWVHNSPQCGGSVYTCARSISMFFSSHDEITVSGYEVRKGGVRLELPHTIENIFIERLADYILVKTTFGFSLAWDGETGVYIKLSEDHNGKPCGLCGNFNGNWSDDLIMQHTGDSTEDIALFANSWNVQTPEEPNCVATESDYPNPCSDEAAQEEVFLKCQVLQQFPFMSCHETIDPYSYIASCINDLCKKDDEETYCRAVMEYARACSHSGFPIRDWRDDFPACTEKCEDNFVHRDCISCCPPTCTYEKECLGSNLHCLDGCYCPDGLILNNGSCVPVTSCPCIYHGMAYPAGSVIEQECSMCVCAGGIWNCTEHECPAECSVIGDAHFTTFDGRYYTFLGTCQYILVKGIGKEKFTITVQKTLCEQNFDHACIQSITLVIDEDINKQVTLFRDGEVQYGSNQGFIINGEIEVRNLSSMFVQVKTKFGIRLQFSKGGDRLYIKASSAWRRRTLGLCGTFNGNLRDDFLSPAGMIEGTPQLHANAWKISSACVTPVNIPIVDPCDINIQNVGFAAHCDIINQELFAPCHTYVNPGQYYQLCRFDACKCGSSCLCNALAHYAYVCNKHGVTVNFRSEVSFCGVICLHGMLYQQCTSFCGRTCASLTSGEVCSDDECVEGCNCPEGKYFDESVNFCVGISSCRCYYRGKMFHPGEVMLRHAGSCQCLNGTMKCTETATSIAGHTCPDGKIYFDCRNPIPGFPSAGVNCEATCANLAMNFTCVPSPPCASGCICPAGMAEHKGKCYVPDSCPCTWKDREYLSGEAISTPCYTCVCRRGLFNCTSYPCPSVCTVYGDRHYYTFDGLEYDYASDCQVYLVKSQDAREAFSFHWKEDGQWKSVDNSNVSVIAQNRKCFDNDIICSKNLVISLGDTDIYFGETSGAQKIYRMQHSLYRYEHWKAGFYTVVHFPELEMTILWDKKTTIHVKVGPRWKGKLAGLCGNFDKYTSNDFTTSNNMEVRNPQVFGDSWTIGQCKSSNETVRPCEVHQSKFPYAKKECSVLYSDVFAPCRNVIDVTSFVKNCHTDTCNCNLGGDCECLCTSIAAYAHKCCQQGVSVHWRSPNLCPYDCDYYNQGLGEGPYILSSCGNKDIVLGVNVTSKHLFPVPRMSAHGRVLFNFMITPGLFKDKDLSLSLVSLESAERPNYFLSVYENDTVQLEQWEANSLFRRRATFFHHQGLWIPGFSAFELHSKKGFFIVLTATEVQVSKYDNSEEFKLSSSFKIEEIVAAVPYRRMCEWKYEPCANPCVKTCSDPNATACSFLPPVEGCVPYCPINMILDEVTLKCVYPEDCVPVTTTDLPVPTKPIKIRPTVTASYVETTPSSIPLVSVSLEPLSTESPLHSTILESFSTTSKIQTSYPGLTTTSTKAQHELSTQETEQSTLGVSPTIPTTTPIKSSSDVHPVSYHTLTPFPTVTSAPPGPALDTTKTPTRMLGPSSLGHFLLTTKSVTVSPYPPWIDSTYLSTQDLSKSQFQSSQTSPIETTGSYVLLLSTKSITPINMSTTLTKFTSLTKPVDEEAGLSGQTTYNVTDIKQFTSIPTSLSSMSLSLTSTQKITTDVSQTTGTTETPFTYVSPLVTLSATSFISPTQSVSAERQTSKAVTQTKMTERKEEIFASITSKMPYFTDGTSLPTFLQTNTNISKTDFPLQNTTSVTDLDMPSIYLQSTMSPSTPKQPAYSPSVSSQVYTNTSAETTTPLISSVTIIQGTTVTLSTKKFPKSTESAAKTFPQLSTKEVSSTKFPTQGMQSLDTISVMKPSEKQEVTMAVTSHSIVPSTTSSKESFSTYFPVSVFETLKSSYPVSSSTPLAELAKITASTTSRFKVDTDLISTEKDRETSQAPTVQLLTTTESVVTPTTESAISFTTTTTTERVLDITYTPKYNASQTRATTEEQPYTSTPFESTETSSSFTEQRLKTVSEPVYTSEPANRTTFERISQQTTSEALSNFTEFTQFGSTAEIIVSGSSVAPILETTSSETVTEIFMNYTASSEYYSYGTMVHTSGASECMPRYIESLDPCSQYVCINMGWILYNVSSNCHKNVEKPNCGFRGMPVQVNSDSCCPEWECPCQCSVLSELSIITFDGNNIALYNAAPYILVRLPKETIVAHIEKCPPSLSVNSIRKLVPAGGTSGLCFKKLNVTTANFQVLINRLERKVEVNSIIQPVPFSKQGLCIQDTGAMYVINTPAGINIKWAHVTGIIDIQYGLHSNLSTKTEGLCGICNGDPSDDLKMQNRTIITNKEDIEAFIKSWEIEKSIDVTTRRPIRNCTEDNCTYCLELLNRKAFSPCHRKVSPQDFCEKMWINNTYFLNYECDALSAYVALCNKHNICIRWRTKDYCSLTCPEGKEYQACVQPCAAKTCLNKWYYEESPCSYLREDCVCQKGTILHRTDSELCIPEEKCACTDNGGNPHSPGEVWNSSIKRCCMSKCQENGTIVAIEPDCSQESVPTCQRKGETLISVIEEGECCPKKVCECNMSLCETPLTCKTGERLVADYKPETCCPKYTCECDLSACPKSLAPNCSEDKILVEARQEDPCCFTYICVCESCTEPVPVCSEGEILTVDLNTTHQCCPHYICVCDENLCSTPQPQCAADTKLVKKESLGNCCPSWSCECDCENVTNIECSLGEIRRINEDYKSPCGCNHYICEKQEVCIFQGITVLHPGQSLIQYVDGELCYTVQCLPEINENSGFHSINISVLNCSKQCEANQVYIPSPSHQMCCGTCRNVSCSFYSDNETLVFYEVGDTWISNCTKFECTKTSVGAMILGSSVVCPPFNDSDCLKNGGTIETYNDGCCKICSGMGVLPFTFTPVVPTAKINCEPGSKEEKICQKVAVRTTIRKSDCFSQSPVTVASCDGKCPSATIFNVNLDSHIRFCKCCRENGIQSLTVPLYCSGNGTEVMYVIQEPLDCSCQWN